MMNRGGASSSSRRGQAEQTGAATGGAPSVNFNEPEACPFLKHVLKSALSGSPQEKLLALKNLAFALPDPLQLLGRPDHALGAAVYLLENGLLPVVVSGLEAAARGDWVELLEERTTGRPTEPVNKAVLYTWLLKRLIHDTRTMKFILHHAPGLQDTLQKMYRIKTVRFPDGMGGLPEMILYDTGLKILGVLTLILVWSEQARRKLARSDAFLTCLLRRILENASREDYAVRALAVFAHVPSLASTQTFDKIAPDCVNVIDFLLNRSASRQEVEYAVKILARIGATQFPTFQSQFLTEPTIVEGAKALLVCSNADKYAHCLSRAMVWASKQAKAGVAVDEKEYSQILATGLTEQQESELQTEASQSAVVLKRTRALIRLYFEQENAICLGHVFAPLLRGADDPSSLACGGSPCGDVINPEPLRRCSSIGCKKFESSSREFKMCSQCKLTAYCSKECQKEAWKAGHKDLCNK